MYKCIGRQWKIYFLPCVIVKKVWKTDLQDKFLPQPNTGFSNVSVVRVEDCHMQADNSNPAYVPGNLAYECIFNIFQKVGMIGPCPLSYYSKKCYLETHWPNLKFRQKTEILQNLGRILTFLLADCGKCPRILPSLTRPSLAGITQKQQKEALSAPCPRRPLLTSCSN